MNTKKKVFAVAVAVLMGAAVAGCSGTQSADPRDACADFVAEADVILEVAGDLADAGLETARGNYGASTAIVSRANDKLAASDYVTARERCLASLGSAA